MCVQKVKDVFCFLWSVKSLFLLPWDIYTDVRLALTHFNNGNNKYGIMTTTFLLPSLFFPYHYYTIVKYVILQFKYLFGKEGSKPTRTKMD